MTLKGRTRTIEHTVDVNRSPGDVFDYCSDLTHEPEWNPKLERIEQLTDGPVGVGTRYEVLFAKGDPWLIEIVRFQRPAVWATTGTSRRLNASFEGRTTAIKDGTHVLFRMELQWSCSRKGRPGWRCRSCAGSCDDRRSATSPPSRRDWNAAPPLGAEARRTVGGA
jgi:uncharacterized protein YndB with AHSA1/START domain